MELRSGTAIVTGASSGIGAAVARALAGAGMNLVITARREPRLEALERDLEPARVASVAADISDAGTPETLLEVATQRFGGCDVIFNGAGSMHAGSIESLDLEAGCRMVRANFEAAARMAYAGLRHFKRRGSGYLINVSSILGTKVRPNTGLYAATKHAIEALSEGLRMEVAGTDIAVSVIQPGLTETELQDHFVEHPSKVLGIDEPLHPEDVARCVRFLLEQPGHVRIPVLMVLPRQQAM